MKLVKVFWAGRLALVGVVAMLCGWTVLAWGQGMQVKATQDQPVAITSERMELDSQKSVVRFSGNVVARQGSFELRSQKLTAQYAAGGEIQTLSSQGDVSFVDQSRSGEAQFATYAVATSSLTMTGNPVVREDGNVLAGSRIDYSTRTGQLNVQNARTRFYQQQAKDLATSEPAP